MTRRSVVGKGLFASIAVALTGGTASLLASLGRATPKPFRAAPLVGSEGQRPAPVLYRFDDQRNDFFLAEYPKSALDRAEKVYEGATLTAMHSGVVALQRRCPHLGSPLSFCESSQWFECASHGAQFNAVGEKKGGPAPRGMTHVLIERTADGSYAVDPHTRFTGAAIGVNTTGQETEGPHCVG